MDAESTVRQYYEALRDGDRIAGFFADEGSSVKFGISEALHGPEEITEGLRTQTDTTTDWTVESRNLVVGERNETGWFTDEVFMAWTDTDRRVRFEFDTRWSGTLVEEGGEYQFATMHVSTAGEI